MADRLRHRKTGIAGMQVICQDGGATWLDADPHGMYGVHKAARGRRIDRDVALFGDLRRGAAANVENHRHRRCEGLPFISRFEDVNASIKVGVVEHQHAKIKIAGKV